MHANRHHPLGATAQSKVKQPREPGRAASHTHIQLSGRLISTWHFTSTWPNVSGQVRPRPARQVARCCAMDATLLPFSAKYPGGGGWSSGERSRAPGPFGLSVGGGVCVHRRYQLPRASAATRRGAVRSPAPARSAGTSSASPPARQSRLPSRCARQYPGPAPAPSSGAW